MKKILLTLIISVFSTSGFAHDQAEDLKNLLNNPDTLSQEAMEENGRIGELFTYAKLVVVDEMNAPGDFVTVVDQEIKLMVEKNELFRHKDGTVDDLFSLIRCGWYDVIYKTGNNGWNEWYNTDGIHKDLLSIVAEDSKKEMEVLLKSVGYAYLRTWNTESEYDGMEKFFIRVDKTRVVILTIDNCGGC